MLSRQTAIPALILSGISAAYLVAMAATGLYVNTFLAFWVVLGIQLTGLALILKGTASTNGYWAQVATGLSTFVILAAVLSVTTYLTLTFVAPDYADRFVEIARARYLASGANPETLETQLAELRTMYRPVRQAGLAIPGTLLTGVAGSLVFSAILRKKTG